MDRSDLSHDAFTINGVYLEDVISGYMTTKAVGRESLQKEIETYVNGSDGETAKRSRFPKRIIEITYLVKGSSLADLREKMHNLQTKLNAESVEIVFNDDPNNYYTASPVMTSEPKDGWNSASGTYSLVCYDPFKYSKTLTTVSTSTYSETVTDEDGNSSTVTSTVLTTDNQGGYKTFPTFNVQFATDENASTGEVGSNADCGYVLFAKGGTDYSVQIGDDKEKDTATITESSQDFTSAKKGGFSDSNSITPFRSKLSFNGSSKATSRGLMINSTTNVSNKFHGPMVVDPFATGHQATAEFTLNWSHVFACSKTTADGKKQCGAFWIMLLDSSNNVKFAYGLEKSSTSKLTAKEYAYSAEDGLWEIDDAYSVKYTGASGYTSKTDTTGRLSTCSIKRYIEYDENNTAIGARTFVYTAEGVESEIAYEDTPCTITKVAVFFGKYGSNAGMYSNRATKIKFINGNADVVNTFGSGDLASVDCGRARITLNKKKSANLGDAGNNWEDMYLDVGTNTIYVQWSDWVNSSYLPTVTMTYRKRWL